MKKLSILLSTINDRIYDAEKILQSKFADTEIVVVHQVTNLSKTDTYCNYYNKYPEETIRFVQMFDKGTGKSRNKAMATATAELMYLCDDDLVLDPSFYEDIIGTADKFPDIDFFTFKIRSSNGGNFKNYPDQTYLHSIRSAAKVSIVEMVIRKSAFDEGKIKFDERFGLATKYNTGEEFVMLTDAIRKKAKGMYIPKFIVAHPPVSSGKIFNEEVAFDKGAMTARVYGWRCVFVNALFAIRKYKEYKRSIGFFNFIIQMYKGSFHFFNHD